ncbi:MAG TPA: ABC transporter ATP-binding protein [Anaeromyxobacteraceae bacterium]|nr:ABC transporter ATP-binding protein [Anaeromyxobacteraceae bacterium]
MDAGIILETRDLVKEFRGFVAVSGVSLRVARGSIHALIGPNGAGKTTVFNLLTRFLPATSGSILYKGEDITGARPADVARRGMVRSFQVSAVFPALTALENVRVALQRPLGTSFHFWRSERSLEALDGRAAELLAAVGLEEHRDTVTGELPYGRKRALEIATTLALDPELLLLDEPTQGMAHEDVGRVVALIRRVAEGRTVLMVEHNLSVVQDLAQRVTVLARGSVLAEGSYDEVSRNPLVLEAYIGASA